MVYMHAHLVPPFTADYLHSSLKLDPGEVGAGAWLDRSLIEAIVAASEEENEKEVIRENLPALFRYIIYVLFSQNIEIWIYAECRTIVNLFVIPTVHLTHQISSVILMGSIVAD